MASDRILEGVLSVLAERGVEALSVRSVAAAAGVSPAQVQYYYRTKTELVRAGFDFAGKQFLADIASAQPDTLMEMVHQWLPLDERRERRARVWLAYSALAVVDARLAAEAARLDNEVRRWFTEQGLPDTSSAHLFALIDGVAVQCLMLPVSDRAALAERSLAAVASTLEREVAERSLGD